MYKPTPAPDPQRLDRPSDDASRAVDARRAEPHPVGIEPQRMERDPVGERAVPLRALYGIQTARALDTFQISSVRVHRGPDHRLRRNQEGGGAGQRRRRRARRPPRPGHRPRRRRSDRRTVARAFSTRRVPGRGRHVDQHERQRGDRQPGPRTARPRPWRLRQLHPNDHVNRSQSTNDTMPTAMRIAALRLLGELVDRGRRAGRGLRGQGGRVGRGAQGRPHAPARRDADDAGPGVRRPTPPTSGAPAIGCGPQESTLAEVPLGGTAIGTGINTPTGFAALAVAHLGAITGLPLREAPDRIASQQSLGDFVALSGALRGLAVELARSPTTCGCSAPGRTPASTRSSCRRCSPARRSCRAR